MKPNKLVHSMGCLALSSFIYLLTGCATINSTGPGAEWTPATLDKGTYHIHYAQPPVSRWKPFECHLVDIAFSNKETMSIMAFDGNHKTTENDPKKAFYEFQEGPWPEFEGKQAIIEEAPVTVLGFPGYYAKVEGIRDSDLSKVYFLHYFLSKNGKIVTFNLSQSAALPEIKRKEDIEVLKFFMNSFQMH